MLKLQPEVTSETSDMARKKTSGKSAAQKPANRAAVRKLSTHKPSPAKSASKGHRAKAQVQAKRPSKPVAAKVDQTKKIVAAKKVMPAAKPVPAKPQTKAVPAPAHKPVAAKPPMLPKAVAIKQAMAAAAGGWRRGVVGSHGAHQVEHDPHRLIDRSVDRFAQPDPFIDAGWLAADQQHPPGFGAELVKHSEHNVRLHAVTVK